jgi:glycosyltransferase involved in cell wall biosynthesis
MPKKEKVLIVLDSEKYSKKTQNLKKHISSLCSPHFYFTDYENKIVRFFHGLNIAGNFLSHIFYWIISFYKALYLFIFARCNFKLKIFVNPIVGFFYCLLLSIVNLKDNVCVSGFLFTEKENKYYYFLRIFLCNFAYKNAKKIFVYSASEIDYYSTIFPNLASKFHFLNYGRDFDIFHEKQYQSNVSYIASGGISNRDYNTLALALRDLKEEGSDLKCRIATRPDIYQISNIPSNLEMIHNVRIDTFGSFLSKSIFVVIPLKLLPLSSGHMTLLEAMSQGKIIIIANIPSVRDYVDEKMVFFYRPADYTNLKDVIRYVLLNRHSMSVKKKASLSRKTYKTQFTFTIFLSRLVQQSIG